MICGIGCDLCAVERMAHLLSDDRFLLRWFTPAEGRYIRDHAQAAQTAAGIFAAKEALVKALGTGFAGLSPEKVSVAHDAQGAPYYDLTPAVTAALKARGAVWAHLSISHDGGMAMAMAVLEGQ